MTRLSTIDSWRVVIRLAALAGPFAVCNTAAIAAEVDRPLLVDLALVLAVDVSSSIDRVEQRVEREGYVDAFRDPEILRAIRSGPLGRIAVIYFEWAGSLHQSVAVPWTIIESGADAEAFASSLAGQPILPEAGTSISASLAFAARLFPVSGTRPLRRAIDISGDGVNNDGPPVAFPRNALIAEGVTINGLPIELGGRSDISHYYKRSVIGGPGSFALTVERSADVVNAIRHKLVLEIAWRPTSAFDAASAGPRPRPNERRDRENSRVRRLPQVSASGQKRTSRWSSNLRLVRCFSMSCRRFSPENRRPPARKRGRSCKRTRRLHGPPPNGFAHGTKAS